MGKIVFKIMCTTPELLKHDYTLGDIDVEYKNIAISQYDGYDIASFYCNFDIFKTDPNDKVLRELKIKSILSDSEHDSRYLKIIKEIKKLKRKGKIKIVR